MTKLLWALVLAFCLSGVASASQTTCATSSTSIDTADSSRILAAFQSEDTTNPVWICPKTACTVTTGWKLPAGTSNGLSWVAYEGREAKTDWSCISTGGNVVVNYQEVKR